MNSVLERSVSELAELLRSGELETVGLTRIFVERAVEVDKYLNCFISLDDEVALEKGARLSVTAAGPSPIWGIPFAYKDIFVRNGIAPSAGVRGISMSLGVRGAIVLDRLEGAGAIPLGRLTLDPVGYAALGTNPTFGDTLNPWDLSRVSGGSSSGAAAAVAARAVPFAIGADTGGSVRIPAAFCGVVGLKPTFGRIPRLGSTPVSYSQDTIGILARLVSDVAVVLDATAGYDGRDSSSIRAPIPGFAARLAASPSGLRRPLAELRIGVDQAYLDEQCSGQIAAAIRSALRVLAGLGATLVGVDLERLDGYDIAATVMTWSEAGAVHLHGLRHNASAYSPAVRSRLHSALTMRAVDHVNAMRFQGVALRQFLDGPLREAEILVVPTTGIAPPHFDMLGSSFGPDEVEATLGLLKLNRPFNFLGVPAMSIPVGFDDEGLPMAMQLIGRPWGESALLRAGAAFQEVADHHLRMPPAIEARRGSDDASILRTDMGL